MKLPENLGPEQLYLHGRDYALLGELERAMLFLERADGTDPRVLNMLGYTTRKMGDVTGGLMFYEKAIALQPDFSLARSYRGEAFLTLGQRDAAVRELDAIAAIEGKDGRPYVQLARAIALFDVGLFDGSTY